MRKNSFLGICGIIVCILAIFVVALKVSKPIYKNINFDKLDTVKTGLVYFGDASKDTEEVFKKVKDRYGISPYVVKTSEKDNIKEYLDENNLKEFEENGYVFIYESSPSYSFEKDIDLSILDEVVQKLVYGRLSEDEIEYIVPANGDEMVNKINRKDYTILVIGKEDCNYCQMYIPVFNKVAKENNLDIYYIDSENYSETEYEKVTNLALEIPAKCTTRNEDTNTKGSFPKPMTIITKKGKTVDCILGYASEEKLVSKLKEYDIIKVD